MRNFFLPPLIASMLLASPLMLPRVAHAQPAVSDLEKQAARQLWLDGVELQKDGKYEAALEKFQKAQRVIQAPTHLVHIAECSVALNKLVAAAEAYRAAIRMDVGGNQAFRTAQDQAAAALRPLEPRIPKLKIDVTPREATNLTIQIDGQPVNSALIDVAIPVDPGTHRVTALAPGYSSDEKTVSLQERDAKTINLTLTQTGMVYTNPDPVPPIERPDPVNRGTRPPRYDRPPPGPGPEAWRPIVYPSVAERSFLLGVRGGAEVAAGNFARRANGTDASISEVAKTGGAFGVEAGFRFQKIYLGLFYEFASFSQGDKFSQVALTGELLKNEANSMQSVTTSLNSHFLGVDLGYISNPDGVAALYADIGVGYRIMPHKIRVEDNASSSRAFELTETYTGPELKLGLGIYIRAGSWLRLVPKVNVGIGSFSNVSTECTSSGLPEFSCSRFTTGSTTLDNTSSHTFVFLGLGGYFDKEIR